MTTNNKKQKLPEFEYKMKLKAAIIGAVFYLLLSSQIAFKIMGMIFNNSLKLLNDKNEPSILAKIIMATIIAFFIFFF
jgi:hypothetical protein